MTRKEWAKLTDKEKQSKVAELCGWERGPKEDMRCGYGIIGKMSCWHPSKDESNWQDYPPPYLNDLNAMHEAEALLFECGKVTAYEHLLAEIVGHPSCPRFHATAAKRAEAFVLTMEGI